MMSPEQKPIPVEQLQFRHAEPVGDKAAKRRCAVCKAGIFGAWFQASGADLCPNCAEAIRRGQQAPPAHSLLKSALYGGAAAVAGCAIYATVAIALNVELALIAILIGYMVGKAVRKGSNGLGGRPQQILAVVPTYFAITFSYVVVMIYGLPQQQAAAAQHIDVGQVVLALVQLAAIAPFLALKSGPGAALSLLIIFFGLRQASRLTGRLQLEIFGPYEAEAGT